MPFLRVKSNLSDKVHTRNSVFSILTDKVPNHKNWFGIAVRRINAFTMRGRSTSASIYLAISSVLGDFVHALYEFKESIFLTPIKITDRWVEHLKNVYLDYYGEEETEKIKWERDYASGETQDAYQDRLIAISNKLKGLFTPKGIIASEIKKAIKDILGNKLLSDVVLREPWQNIKPYPGSKQYVVSKFDSESDSDFEKRLSIYKKYYNDKAAVYKEGKFISQPNTVYPTVFSDGESLVVKNISEFDVISGVGSDLVYREEDQIKTRRIDLLKNDLGSYTYLEGSTRKYLSLDEYGAVLEASIHTSDLNFDLQEGLNFVKAAGIKLSLNVHFSLGEATSTNQADAYLGNTTSLELGTVSLSQISGSFFWGNATVVVRLP